jgi:hypothetical protein
MLAFVPIGYFRKFNGKLQLSVPLARLRNTRCLPEPVGNDIMPQSNKLKFTISCGDG